MTFPAVTPLTAALFDLPPTAQRESNLCSMVNFFPEARRIMEKVELKHIVEIGCENGLNTAALFAYARSRRAKLTAVDPAAIRFPFEATKESCFTFFRGTSREFLDGGFCGEIIFMDGDHNYETVIADLRAIDRDRNANGVKIVFMHDVSWPWARRDNYYDLSQVSRPHPNGNDVNVSPYAEADKFYLPPFNYSVAEAEGGEQNGVLTAVEDFLAGNENSWRFWRVPVFYGIGILCCTDNLNDAEYAAVREEADSLADHRELLATLELNRIENLCLMQSLQDEISRAGYVWTKDQKYIEEANLSLSKLTEKFEFSDAQITYLQSVVSKNDAMIDSLRSSLDRSVANETFQKEVCAKLMQQIEHTRSEYDLARQERENLRDEVGELTRQNQTAVRECVSAKNKITELEEDNRQLSGRLTAEQALSATQKELIEQGEKERDRILRECRDAEARNDALKQQLGERDSALAEVSGDLECCRTNLRKSQEREQALETAVWCKDQSLRKLLLERPEDAWRVECGAWARHLPYGLCNRGKLRKARALLVSRGIEVLSLDIFDTLLLREARSELERFREIAILEAAHYPEIGAQTLYEARALAHQLTYHSKDSIQGCREPGAAAIFACMANILGLSDDAAGILADLELQYEIDHLRANPAICELVRLAKRNGIPVIAVSDMYWSGERIMELLRKCLPEDAAVDRVYCSSDVGVSKASGLLFDRVLKELRCPPEKLLHAGDNLESDCRVPFLRHGINAVWMPRSYFYNRKCAHQQLKMMDKLKSKGVIHGV